MNKKDEMQKKPIVIAGNGPSLAQIDYRRLPADFDVFRCNQFYFEDKYFLGRHVTGAFLNAHVLKQQYYTYHMLQQHGEYKIQNIYCAWSGSEATYEKGRRIQADFPALKNIWPYLQALPRFHECQCFWDVYHGYYFTSAVWMLITALAQGYTEIYIVGLDFYQKGSLDYAFDVNKPNLIRALPSFGNKNFHHEVHDRQVDLSVLELALEMPDVNIYSVCESSPINQYVPQAAIVNQAPGQLEAKDPDAISDLCVLPERVSAGGGEV